jgi:sarcosine oxidase delta subunit
MISCPGCGLKPPDNFEVKEVATIQKSKKTKHNLEILETKKIYTCIKCNKELIIDE